MKIKISWLLFLLYAPCVYGQEFNFEATVTPVTQAGYYKVMLSPELLGKLKTNQSDLRIYDSSDKEQPYVLYRESAISTTSLFKEYNIIERAYEKDSLSYLTFENPNKETIDNVSFIVKNTDVQKRARLSGSDDQNNWYVIKNNYLLHAMQSTEGTSELKVLNFPSSDYRYFKLEIDDNKKLPINILKVGYYDTHQVYGVSTQFDCPVAYQKDSLKISYVKLDLSERKYVEKLKFELTGAEYYSRYAELLVRHERLNKKKKKEVYFESIGSIELNSNSRNEVNLRGLSQKEIYVEIHNKDNQPLSIVNVTASYLNKYVLTQLEPNQDYRLMFGEMSLSSPEYDLKKFADKILPGAMKTNHGTVIGRKSIEVKSNEVSNILENTYFIWTVILLVGALLGFVSLKMIKEMK